MAKLSLMFEEKTVKEVPVGTRPVSIGRSPDNDLPVDNLAVSNYHARVYFEGGRLVVEDLDSLNGTFVNDLRVERATLHDGDSIWIGKHHIKVDASGDAPVPWDTGRKASAPRINETMVLDTKARREMLQAMIENRPSSTQARAGFEAAPQTIGNYVVPRRYVRVPLESPLRAHIDGAQAGLARVRTISLGGAYLESPKKLAVGDSIKLEVRSGLRRIYFTAVVRNPSPHLFGHQRVIAGELLQIAAPQQIGPRISDMGDA